MTENSPNNGRPGRRRLGMVFGLFAAAAGIAAGYWLINAGQSPELTASTNCAVDDSMRSALDAAAQGELAGMVATVSGHGYDDLSFLDPEGAPTSLRALRGEVLLVNFWATWCIPCRIEMPALSALQTTYEGRGAQVVTINLDVGTDGPQKAAAFLEEINTPNLPLYADPTLKSFEALRQRGAALGLPTTLLIGPDGCEWGVLQGPAEWNTPDGHRLVDAAIAIAGARA